MTDAQRRAKQKYERTLKTWGIKLKPNEFEMVEKARGKTSRKKWLLEIAKEKLNKN